MRPIFILLDYLRKEDRRFVKTTARLRLDVVQCWQPLSTLGEDADFLEAGAQTRVSTTLGHFPACAAAEELDVLIEDACKKQLSA